MGKIADHVAKMLAEGARSADIVEWIAKQEAREEKAQIEEWKVTEAFAVFWKHYPHKIGRPDALKAMRTVLRSFTLEQIMVGLERYVRTKRPDQPWLNPATFLRQERFKDEPAAVAPRNKIDAARYSLLQEIEDDHRRTQGQEGSYPPSIRRF